MKRLQGLPALLGLLVCAVAIGADGKDDVRKLLIGRWEVKRKIGERDLSGEMAFTADGKASMKVKGPKGDVTFAGSVQPNGDFNLTGHLGTNFFVGNGTADFTYSRSGGVTNLYADAHVNVLGSDVELPGPPCVSPYTMSKLSTR